MGEALHNTLNQTPLFVRAKAYAVALGLSAVTAAGCGGQSGQETPSPDQALGGGNTPVQEASPSVNRSEGATPDSPDSSSDSPSPTPGSSSETYIPAEAPLSSHDDMSQEERNEVLKCLGVDPYNSTTPEEAMSTALSNSPEVVARCMEQ